MDSNNDQGTKSGPVPRVQFTTNKSNNFVNLSIAESKIILQSSILYRVWHVGRPENGISTDDDLTWPL